MLVPLSGDIYVVNKNKKKNKLSGGARLMYVPGWLPAEIVGTGAPVEVQLKCSFKPLKG